MRIACPACEATYEIPDQLIGVGRRLRCARCGHAWLAQPPPAEGGKAPAGAAQALHEAPAPAGAQALPLPRPSPRRPPQIIDPPLPRLGDSAPAPKAALWAAWIASILLLALFVVALWAFRDELVAAWPPIARLYMALGLEADP